MQMLVSVGTAGGGASLQIGDYDIFLKTVLSSCPACPHFFFDPAPRSNHWGSDFQDLWLKRRVSA